MRRLPLLFSMLFLAAPATAQEDGTTVRDKKSGLVIGMPEQWNRESGREKGGVRFAAIYDLSKSRYVLFSVETGPATGFDEGQWLAKEKAGAEKSLKTTDIAWTTEPVMIGGVRAVRYTIGGKANAEKAFDLRVRGCGLVRNDVFFRILELSYGKAHEESADAIKAMWEAVKFEEANPFAEEEKEEGCGEEEKPAGGEGAKGPEAAKGEPTVIEDKAGNFKLTAAPGWSLDRAAAEGDEDAEIRLVLQRATDNGDIVASMEVFRIRWDDSTAFTNDEPGDFIIKKLGENSKFFEAYYEAGSAKTIRPDIDARARLGDAEKTCGYEVRSMLPSEEAKITEAQKLRARGDMSVTVPEFAPLVVRGRIAMISPYIYITRTVFRRRSLSDNEELLAEYNGILDSWEFESTEGRPPPLKASNEVLGDTRADAANKEERKKSKLWEFKKGTKVEAALKIDYVLPPGFQEADAVEDEAARGAFGGSDVVLQVVAQDDNNGWVWFRVVAISQKSLPPRTKFEEKQTTFGSWISNFESQARGTGRLPKKPEKISVGNLRGDGCEMSGKINKFRASELNMVTIEGGWWIRFEMRTRGGGAKAFEDEIKTFLRKFRATKK